MAALTAAALDALCVFSWHLAMGVLPEQHRAWPLNRDLHAVCSEYPEGVSFREYINDGLFHGCEIFLYFNRN